MPLFLGTPLRWHRKREKSMGKKILRTLRSRLYITDTQIIFTAHANKSFRGPWPGPLTLNPPSGPCCGHRHPPVVVSRSCACRGVFLMKPWTSTPLKHGSSLRPVKNEDGTQIFIFSWKWGWGKNDYVNHIIALHKPSLLSFTKIFTPTTLARLHYIIQFNIKNASMQRDFTNPSYIFLYLWCYYPWQSPSKMH